MPEGRRCAGEPFQHGSSWPGMGEAFRRRHRLCVYQSGAARPVSLPRPGRTMSAFSVCNALRFKSYSLLFCAKTVVFPLTSGRAALCCSLAFCLFQWQHALVAAFFPASGWRRQNLKMALSCPPKPSRAPVLPVRPALKARGMDSACRDRPASKMPLLPRVETDAMSRP